MLKTYKVEGMTCGGCAEAVENAIRAVLPGASVKVNVAAGEVVVDGVDDDERIRTVVEEAGFDYGGPA
ncbi:MAG TPA: copper chaperone [Sedimenticola sp.]|nr:copper chaperone [Sedimenticola sp.]